MRTAEVVGQARERHRELGLANLPEALQRNSLDYYYLSVWPGLRDLHPVERLTLPPRPPEVSYAYLHLPFCSGICDFCSYFLTTAGAGGDPKIDRYLDQLLGQLRLHLRDLDIRLTSIYLGGGTPSMLTPDQLDRLLGTLWSLGICQPQLAGTMELHPEIFTEVERLDRTLAVLTRHGIRRVSIGYQSSDEELLAITGRRHEAAFLPTAAAILREHGFRFNVDLMYGLPGQRIEEFTASLAAVLAVAPDSLSTYFTFIDPGTGLWRRVQRDASLMATSEEAQLCQLVAQMVLEGAGYHELPGDFWAVPTSDPADWDQLTLPSQANSLALGAGAYGYYPGVQYFNEFHFGRYARAISEGRLPLWRAAVLSPDQELARDVMFSVKNAPLLSRPLFLARHGRDPVIAFERQFDQLVRLGLAEVGERAARLTPKGRLVVEEIACLFAPPTPDRPSGTVPASRVEAQLIDKHHFAPTYGRA